MKDLTNGNITKNILLLSWPTMIAMLMHVGFNLIDTIFVGRLGPDAIAAVSLVFPVVFLMFALGGGLGVGTTSIIARYIGAKKIKEADNAAEHSFILALIFSAIFTLIGLFFAKDLFALMGASVEITQLAMQYSRWIFGFNLFMFIGLTATSILRGVGDMKTPMIGMVTATVLNIILDPLLIFGIGFFPELGIDGAAIATIISRAVAAVIMMIFIFSPKTAVNLKPRDFKFKFNFIKEILRVGIPTSINQGLMSIALGVYTKIISVFGSLAIAAYGIGFRLESLIIMPVLAIMTAVITLVGQNVGANKFERAEKTVWSAAKISMSIVFIISLLFFIFPQFLISIFTKDPELIILGADFLRILSFSYIFVAAAIVVGGAFQGAGKPSPPLTITAIRLYILGIPLSLLFAFTFNFGLNGVWIGLTLSSIIASIAAVIWFKLGTWKKETLK